MTVTVKDIEEAEIGQTFEVGGLLRGLAPGEPVKLSVTHKSSLGAVTMEAHYFGVYVGEFVAKPDGSKIIWTELSV